MIAEGMRRITDAHWVLLMAACREGDLSMARGFLRSRYKMSEGEAEAWVVAVVAAKAWNL